MIYATSVQKTQIGYGPDLSLPRKRPLGLFPSCSLTNKELCCLMQFTCYTRYIYIH